MTNEEALNIAIQMSSCCIQDNIIRALEKQIKKKPIKKTNLGSAILDGKYCPRCDLMFDRASKYCECCGQAIDWSEE